ELISDMIPIRGLNIYDLRDLLPSIILTQKGKTNNYKLKKWNTRKDISHIIIHQTVSSTLISPLHYYEGVKRINTQDGKITIVERLPYHFVISENGYVFWLNDLDKITWHTGGDYNTTGLAIAVVGNFNRGFPFNDVFCNIASNTMSIAVTPENTFSSYIPKNPKTIMKGSFPINIINDIASMPTNIQFKSLHRLLRLLLNNKIQDKDVKLNLNKYNIKGHCECWPKEICPGAALMGYIKGLRANDINVDNDFSVYVSNCDIEAIQFNNLELFKRILKTKSL
ncbi:MAG: peptidoglycan recognition protein family protein, partial [Candidatus Odinarchaeia archaeon]